VDTFGWTVIGSVAGVVAAAAAVLALLPARRKPDFHPLKTGRAQRYRVARAYRSAQAMRR
jgi:hypothetical protein